MTPPLTRTVDLSSGVRRDSDYRFYQRRPGGTSVPFPDPVSLALREGGLVLRTCRPAPSSVNGPSLPFFFSISVTTFSDRGRVTESDTFK